jgi:hypothetical protein
VVLLESELKMLKDGEHHLRHKAIIDKNMKYLKTLAG